MIEIKRNPEKLNVLELALHSEDTEAHERQRSGSWQTSKGGSGTWSSDREITRANGDTASWHKSGQKTGAGAVVHGAGTHFRGQAMNMDRTLTRNNDGMLARNHPHQ